MRNFTGMHYSWIAGNCSIWCSTYPEKADTRGPPHHGSKPVSTYLYSPEFDASSKLTLGLDGSNFQDEDDGTDDESDVCYSKKILMKS